MRNSSKMCRIMWCCFFVLVLVSGCGKKGVDYETTSGSIKPEGQMVGSSEVVVPDVPVDVTAGDLEQLDRTGANPLAPDSTSEEYRLTYGRSTAPLLPIFFDFDSSAIRVDQLERLNTNAAYLLENEALRVQVEGNCDARGTVDYNLALGELRALNVKKYLTNLGVAEERISTISYGGQRPLFPDADEESWAMNRRADLVVNP